MNTFWKHLKKSGRGMFSMAPMIVAIVGLVGLFGGFVTQEMLASFFTGNPVTDTLLGTVAGMVAVGQAMISYILGGELLGQGVSFYAVAAFVLAWVTLGVVQLPAEIEVFGGRFVLVRNVLAVIATIAVATAAAGVTLWLA
jgi:uncharacterized membrane protein YraQ (UPF0718 family)